MRDPVTVEIESASRPGLKHTVRLGNKPSCTCEAFQFGGTKLCRHIRIARVRAERARRQREEWNERARRGDFHVTPEVAEEEKRRKSIHDKRPSAYKSIATTPTESPSPGTDDDLREVLQKMPLDRRVDAIDRLAKKMGT